MSFTLLPSGMQITGWHRHHVLTYVAWQHKSSFDASSPYSLFVPKAITKLMEEKQYATLPGGDKGLVACRVCALIKTSTQFRDDGCDNCVYPFIRNYFMDAPNQTYMMSEAVTANFEGTVSIMQPRKSWVARWQGSSTLRPGTYAQKVFEEPGPDLTEELKKNKLNWITKEDVV